MENKKNGLVWVLVVIIVVLLGLVGYLGYNLYSKKDLTNDVNNANNRQVEPTIESNNTEIKPEVLEGENTELSKIVNDYIATLDKTDVEKEYNVTKVAHVVPWNNPDDKTYEIQFKYYYKNTDLNIIDYGGIAFTENEILNLSANLKGYLKTSNISIAKVNDISDDTNYYLVELKIKGTGDIYDNTKHYIYSTEFTKLYTIPELTASHFWLKDGNSVLSDKTITAELEDNKIYSLSDDEANNYYEYESYMNNGKFVSNVIKTFNNDNLEFSGQRS